MFRRDFWMSLAVAVLLLGSLIAAATLEGAPLRAERVQRKIRSQPRRSPAPLATWCGAGKHSGRSPSATRWGSCNWSRPTGSSTPTGSTSGKRCASPARASRPPHRCSPRQLASPCQLPQRGDRHPQPWPRGDCHESGAGHRLRFVTVRADRGGGGARWQRRPHRPGRRRSSPGSTASVARSA